MPTEVVLIGDFHIPYEADQIPKEFLEEVKEADLVLCTGDLVSEGIFQRLKDVADRLRIVKGEEDHLKLPEQDLINVEDMKVGLIHGHQFEDGGGIGQERGEGRREEESEEEKNHLEKLVEFADLLEADMLVTGHTHKPFRTEKEGIALFNPGSATGATEDEDGKKTCLKLVVEEKDIIDSKVIDL